MKNKVIFRRVIDLLMALALIFLMGYQLWGEAAHEWVGIGMGVLFIAHQVLNRKWYRSLTRGNYSPMRILHTLVNALAFLAILALLVSGILLSNHVFTFVPAASLIGTAQRVHLAASHWLYVLLALHFGLHWQ